MIYFRKNSNYISCSDVGITDVTFFLGDFFVYSKCQILTIIVSSSLNNSLTMKRIGYLFDNTTKGSVAV